MIKNHLNQIHKTKRQKTKTQKTKTQKTKMSKVIRAHSASFCVNCQNKIHIGDDVIEKEKDFMDKNFGQRTLSESIKNFTNPVSWVHEFCQKKTNRRQRRVARYWTEDDFKELKEGFFPEIKN